MQDFLPVFRECDNINYLRYASWYLEKMKKLPSEHPDIYEQFKQNKMFVVKTNHGSFNAVGTDMKLEQTIQRSKKSAGGIIGQTKEVSFVLEWEIVYHEILAIVNCFAQINRIKGLSDSNIDSSSVDHHHELSGGYGKLFHSLVDKVVKFVVGRTNPYKVTSPAKLHNFMTGEIVPCSTSSILLSFFSRGKTEFLIFRNERFFEKTKLLSDTIKKLNRPKFGDILSEPQRQPSTHQSIK